MIEEALVTICVGIGFIALAAMTVLSLLMIGETTEDQEPFSDWVFFSWASLPFRPGSLTIEGMRYRKWYLKLLVALITAIFGVLATAILSRL